MWKFLISSICSIVMVVKVLYLSLLQWIVSNGCVNLSCKTCEILVSQCILRWLLNLFFPWKVLRDAQFLVKDYLTCKA